MRIAVFGDSIVWGAYDPEGGGWVTRLRNWCEKNRADVEVYNLGVSGDTTRDLMDRFEVEAAARKPDVVVFSIGVNNIRRDGGECVVPIAETERNMRELIARASAVADEVLVLGIGNIGDEAVAAAGDSYTEKDARTYDSAVESAARAGDATYVALNGVLSAGDYADGLHPNSQGHQKIFTLVKDTLAVKNILWTLFTK